MYNSGYMFLRFSIHWIITDHNAGEDIDSK